MSVPEAVLTALFCMAVVFAVLVLLWVVVLLSCAVIRRIERKAAVAEKTEK